MSVPFKIILVFLMWHAFFVGMKVLLSTLNILDRRFLKSVIATVFFIVVVFLLISPGSIAISKVMGTLFGSLTWAVGGPIPNRREYLGIAIIAGNFLLFSIAHRVARNSRNPVLKMMYDFNYLTSEQK